MTYNYNGNLTFEERVGFITKELMEYGLDKETALKVASFEEPITTDDKYYYMFKRLSNILRISNDSKIKDKVIKDMFNNYKEGNKKIDKYMEDLSIHIEYNTELPILE